MIPADPASARQVKAADPRVCTWLSANAGSGKTRVLTDRVARLLLRGVAPQRILCLTYTKAAASEMQNRLFDRLGEWAMLEEGRLRDQLAALGIEDAIAPDALARARRLFARAIETPGGLKIQTIHAFCAGLLRRFPLEAGVSPQFVEMDERAAKLLREDVLEELAQNAPNVMDTLARHVAGDDMAGLTGEIVQDREALSRPLDRAQALALFDLPRDFDAGQLPELPFDGSEKALFGAIVPVLRAQSAGGMQALARTLAAIDPGAPTRADLDALFAAFLYDGGRTPEPKTKSIPAKKAAEALGDLTEDLHAFMRRVAEARAAELSLAAAEKTLALHSFAAHYLPAVEARKTARGWLDFDDLIHRARVLLTDSSVAQWVLYRLDGGVDHILVDEAQDTSPEQWRVIECLTQELTAGEGAEGAQRTLFVVGDKKQSIYSFQGADLRAFDAMRATFAAKLSQVRLGLAKLSLEHSFRSSAAVLQLVDLTFDEHADRGLGGAMSHIAYFPEMPGRVDLWPPVEKADSTDDRDWWDPVDIVSKEHHSSRLARRIAEEITMMLRQGVAIRDVQTGEARRVRAGDFLILVRRRSALFHQIIAACKSAGLAIAGADRMNLGAELAVKDLTALMSFLATPEDDLSLAAALRSPLFGWSEADLFKLAHGRGRAHLWAGLRARDDAAATRDILVDLRDHADFLRPFELIERMLTRHDGRRRLLARLGPEAEDGIDALLAQALTHERMEVPSLTGFLAWLESDDVEVKRQLDRAGDRIRVMTVHGAKGLESPIVILPDTARRGPPRGGALCAMPGGRVAWKTPASEAPPALAQALEMARRAQQEEDARLLYVAMTRAESWLIVAAAGEVGDGACWYDRVEHGLRQAGAAEHEFSFGPGLRLEHGQWPDIAHPEETRALAAPIPLPDWARSPAPRVEPPEAPLSPSDLGGAKALPGEAAVFDEDAAKRRGRLLHRLLEHLPLWHEADWPRIADDLIATDGEGEGEQGTGGLPTHPDAGLLEEARAVLSAPDLGFLFTSEALAEVEITCDLDGRRLLGVIDRLLIGPNRVLAVDYKSNAVVPDRPEDVPEGLLRQMAAYGAALRQIYPDQEVALALLWTRSAKLMPLPHELVHGRLAPPGA